MVNSKKKFPNHYQLRHELTICDELLFRDSRIVVPESLQQNILQMLHEGHMGADAMKSIAQQCVWWTTITKDIEQYAKSCTHCCEGKDHSHCNWTSWPPEEEKWSRVHIDYAGPFFDGCYILVLVDAYSRWAEAHVMKSTTTSDTTI